VKSSDFRWTHDVLLLLAFIIWKVRESRRQQATVRRDPAAAVFFSLHPRVFAIYQAKRENRVD
jgi:hypothetical protein